MINQINRLLYISLFMVFQALLITFLLLAAHLLNKNYFSVKKEIQRYNGILKRLGYRAFNVPLKPMAIPIVSMIKEARQKYSDALYYQKNVYKNYDFVITNVFSSVAICFVGTQFTKLLVSANMLENYEKVKLPAMSESLGQGLVFAEGEQWRNKRKTLCKAFKHDILVYNMPKMIGIINRSFNKFEQRCQIGPQTYKYNILDLSGHMISGFITQCFFGVQQIKEKIDDTEFSVFACKILADSNVLSISPVGLLFGKYAYKWGVNNAFRDFKRRVTIFKAIAQQTIELRRATLQKIEPTACTDILEALIREKIDGQQRYAYTNKDIIEQFCTFLLVGIDTTSHFITMMLYYISSNPEIQKKLRKYVESVITSDEDITIDNLKKVSYLDWIQTETTRIYGPGSHLLLRKAVKDHYVGDIPIRAGTLVTSLFLSLNYKQEYFDNPDEFRPQRWENLMDSPAYNIVNFGFSGGPRTCIGKHFALLTSKIVIVKLLLRYKKITSPQKHPVMNMKFIYEPEPFQTQFIK